MSKPATLDPIAQRVADMLEQEQRAKLDALHQQAAAAIEREQRAQAVLGQLAALKERLVALQDDFALEEARRRAEAALGAYGAAMEGKRAELRAVDAEILSLGSQVPAGMVETTNSGITIDGVTVARPRLQANIARIAMDVVKTFVKRGAISLDSPQD